MNLIGITIIILLILSIINNFVMWRRCRHIDVKSPYTTYLVTFENLNDQESFNSVVEKQNYKKLVKKYNGMFTLS